VIYPTLPELLHVAERVLGPDYTVRDYGLLEAALARPRATAFGKDAYPDLDAKAAALLHSIARNHALIDGNKRLALASVIAFYGFNGRRLTLTNDEAYDLVMSVAEGRLDTVDAIAAAVATQPRRLPDVRQQRCLDHRARGEQQRFRVRSADELQTGGQSLPGRHRQRQSRKTGQVHGAGECAARAEQVATGGVGQQRPVGYHRFGVAFQSL
jgi:death-on-curing protein